MNRSCHDGAVTVIKVHGQQVVTGGVDGCLRCWLLHDIVNAEPRGSSMDCAIHPCREVNLGSSESPVRVDAVFFHQSQNARNLLIVDSSGQVSSCNADCLLPPVEQLSAHVVRTEVVCLASFHSGPVTGVTVSPCSHLAVSSGHDGSLRCWDYALRHHLFARFHRLAVTTVCCAPKILDPSGRTVAAGYSDGSLRVYYRNTNHWLRVQALRPHKCTLTTMEFGPDGHLLATGSADHLVFIIRCRECKFSGESKAYEPVGCVDMNSAVIHISFQSFVQESVASLLTVCQDGTVCELSGFESVVPSCGSFCISVPIRKIWDCGRADANTWNRDGTSDEPRLAHAGPHTEASHAICAIHAKKASDIILSFRRGHGFRIVDRSQSRRDPTFDVSGCAWHTESTFSVIGMKYSTDGALLAAALSDGAIILFPTEDVEEFRTRPVRGTWIQCHACDVEVADMSIAHNGNFLLSCGSDGLLVVQHLIGTHDGGPLTLEGNVDSRLHEIDVHPNCGDNSTFDAFAVQMTQDACVAEGDDLNPDDLSLEVERRRRMEAGCKAAADLQQQGVRKQISMMRDAFVNIRALNDTIPEGHRLTDAELIIDPEYCRILEDECESQIAQLRCKHHDLSERLKLKLKILKELYTNTLEEECGRLMEGQVMSAIAGKHVVGSFRVVKMTSVLKRMLNEVHATLYRNKAGEGTLAHPDLAAVIGPHQSELKSACENVKVELCDNNFDCSHLDWRRRMRALRKMKLSNLWAQQPSQDEDNPQGLLAKENEALRNLGDYKLKSAVDYEVPLGHEVNIIKKRQQMMLLQENLHSICLRYNRRFFALLDVKQLIIDSLTAGQALCRDIEARMHDVREPTHIKYSRTSIPPTPTLQCNCDLSHVLDSECRSLCEPLAQTSLSPATASSPYAGAHALHLRPNERAYVDEMIAGKLWLEPYSQLSQVDTWSHNDAHALMHVYNYELAVVASKMKHHARAFDDALRELRKEYIPLQADIKSAEMRLISLLQEHSLLETFEAQDSSIKAKLKKCEADTGAVDCELADCTDYLHAKQAEQSIWKMKETEILTEFAALIEDNHRHQSKLVKMFHRKLRRCHGTGINDDGDVEVDLFEPCEDDDADADEDENGQESCPADCDPALYEKVMDLREKSRDVDDAKHELQRLLDESHRSIDRHLQRKKQIARDLSLTIKLLRMLQNDKHQHLNQ
mmetsp:Transcript_14728/g.58914  ORF Transcript_14728/g.58914 Transcript_14728/m.58914 type:complete len:1201 (-) Transcript_14728:1414-5016(-)